MAQVTQRFKNLLDWMTRTEFYRSIYRLPTPFDTATKKTRIMRENLWLHLLPTRLPENWLAFSYSYFLGIISFYLFLVLTFTGLLLMLYYRPTIALAYRDMLDFKYGVVPFGMFMRNVHRWAAHGMLIAVMLHMLRVFYSGAYKPPRQFNWVLGVFLLVITFLLSFTGYLLPWDQLALWAITVGSNMASYTPFLGYQGPFAMLDQWSDAHFVLLGGSTVGEGALIRFYVLHCVILPVILAFGIAYHFWRVRMDEFSYPVDIAPGPEAWQDPRGYVKWAMGVRETLMEPKLRPKVFVWPNFVILSSLSLLFVTILLVVAGIVFQAPLEEMADPSHTPNPSKAPWYFVGLQEMLVYFDPWIAGVVLPTLIIIGLMLIPFLDINPKGIGTFPLSRQPWKERKFAMYSFTFGFALWFVLILIGYYFRGPNWQWYWPWEEWAVEKQVGSNIHLTVDDWIFCQLFTKTVDKNKVKKDLEDGVLAHCWNKKPGVAQATEGAAATDSGEKPEYIVVTKRISKSWNIIGWFFLVGFYALGMWLPRKRWPWFYEVLGPIRYATTMFLMVTMIGLIAKILLRLIFAIKYVVITPQFNI
ncbi:MAG: cytochrome b N-terminal domain-containing protein [bacterium JZ-2024 1]